MSKKKDLNDHVQSGGEIPDMIAASVASTTTASSRPGDARRRPTSMRREVTFPDLDQNGKPFRDRRANTEALFSAYGIEVRYNRMTKEQEVRCSAYAPVAGREQNATLNWVQSVAADHGLSRNAVLSHIEADNRSYHPVEDWMESKAWNGVSRMEKLFATLELDSGADPVLCFKLLRLWAVSCAVAVWSHRPYTFATQGVLILQGEQSAHKTRWFESLAPPSLKAIHTGHVLDPTDRDNVEVATAHWIVELGELDATFKKKDIAVLKAFVTKTHDKYRSAYARRADAHPRQTVLVGTVNERKYLADETGNRRWWTVPVTRCHEDHGIDMQQFWAEMLHLAKKGERWWLNDLELSALNEANGAHEPEDPMMVAVRQTWEPCEVARANRKGFSIMEIWRQLPSFRERTPTRADSRGLSKVLRDMKVTEHKTGACQLFHVRVRDDAQSPR